MRASERTNGTCLIITNVHSSSPGAMRSALTHRHVFTLLGHMHTSNAGRAVAATGRSGLRPIPNKTDLRCNTTYTNTGVRVGGGCYVGIVCVATVSTDRQRPTSGTMMIFYSRFASGQAPCQASDARCPFAPLQITGISDEGRLRDCYPQNSHVRAWRIHIQ